MSCLQWKLDDHASWGYELYWYSWNEGQRCKNRWHLERSHASHKVSEHSRYIYIYIHSLATNRTRQHENNSKACTLSTASPAPLSFTLCLSFSLSLFFVFHFSAQRNNIATLSHNTSRALEEIIIALCLILGTINFFSRKWICSHFLQILMLPRYARLIVHSFVIHEYHSSTILIFQTFSWFMILLHLVGSRDQIPDKIFRSAIFDTSFTYRWWNHSDPIIFFINRNSIDFLSDSVCLFLSR